MIHVLTAITGSYRYSRELALSLRMFRKALPPNTQLSVLEHIEEESSEAMNRALADSLEQPDITPYVMLVREPAVLMGPGAVPALIRVLEDRQDLDCVVPMDQRGFSEPGLQPDYFTLGALERFVRELQRKVAESSPYDGRDPFMFVVRTEALKRGELPEDPFHIPASLGERTALALKAYVHPFFDYYNEKREDILSLVPSDAGSVLDIGCSRGAFGAKLKERWGCRVVGIEMNAAEADRAKRRLDAVLVGDALEIETDERFDCVTCLDTLEHFAEPDRLLARIRSRFLKERGCLVVTLPNVGHWSMVENLLAGRWDYLPVGILTNTHLRFFTLSSAQEMLEDSGFQVGKVVRVPADMPDAWRSSLQCLKGKGIEVDWESLEALSYSIVAKKL